ncbi:2-keto-4-pentenoate hydratase/2-oxohepta-3-ene-1,7-dioic acid hydratase in catechol pathway [Rhizomicrobium palustre]|uniref:2-keto-4-pentenoate hydratase/2-oxohepta-3-ene-1,7-dioic acid hydratase in catechol pathway n=1 Tax=Rhizomicrobium palustre TaxID=189966 RepID=A0A846N115_9PROT|nr:fumarylacetoacetate hydrolase family protein [Rhizomicrobium palustre]NIK89263.1 2-keto-4-pentenoate hydratase/2-oxohepta-3-ene-1,7-dioic acid hydratase in catechol pathway [Rhizomicrobium palustre]
MKLVTFATGGQAAIGRVEEGGILPLPFGFGSMIDLINHWPEREAQVRNVTQTTALEKLPLKEAILLPPIPRPGKILAIGLNYADHIREMGGEIPERQVWFCKQPTAANGPFQPIILPKVAREVDYEAELVAVIGKGGRHISREEAPNHVFGYCVGNDVSVRDWQMATSQWMLGKSFDTHAPFGPWITTADEIGDPHGLGVRAFVNGELRQDSDTSNLVFDLWEQIALVSQVMTLEPGDLIFTGTPGGVGMGFKPPRYLGDGDIVRIEIDRLGTIEAVCEREE